MPNDLLRRLSRRWSRKSRERTTENESMPSSYFGTPATSYNYDLKVNGNGHRANKNSSTFCNLEESISFRGDIRPNSRCGDNTQPKRWASFSKAIKWLSPNKLFRMPSKRRTRDQNTRESPSTKDSSYTNLSAYDETMWQCRTKPATDRPNDSEPNRTHNATCATDTFYLENPNDTMKNDSLKYDCHNDANLTLTADTDISIGDIDRSWVEDETMRKIGDQAMARRKRAVRARSAHSYEEHVTTRRKSKFSRIKAIGKVRSNSTENCHSIPGRRPVNRTTSSHLASGKEQSFFAPTQESCASVRSSRHDQPKSQARSLQQGEGRRRSAFSSPDRRAHHVSPPRYFSSPICDVTDAPLPHANHVIRFRRQERAASLGTPCQALDPRGLKVKEPYKPTQPSPDKHPFSKEDPTLGCQGRNMSDVPLRRVLSLNNLAEYERYYKFLASRYNRGPPNNSVTEPEHILQVFAKQLRDFAGEMDALWPRKHRHSSTRKIREYSGEERLLNINILESSPCEHLSQSLDDRNVGSSGKIAEHVKSRVHSVARVTRLMSPIPFRMPSVTIVKRPFFNPITRVASETEANSGKVQETDKEMGSSWMHPGLTVEAAPSSHGRFCIPVVP